MFTPLHELETKEGINKNKYAYLLLEDRLLKYEVAVVFIAKQYQELGELVYYKDAPKFFETNYSKEQFDTFVAAAKKHKYNDYFEVLNHNDKLLTLQTCIEDTIDKFVVTLKLVDTTYIK